MRRRVLPQTFAHATRVGVRVDALVRALLLNILTQN